MSSAVADSGVTAAAAGAVAGGQDSSWSYYRRAEGAVVDLMDETFRFHEKV